MAKQLRSRGFGSIVLTAALAAAFVSGRAGDDARAQGSKPAPVKSLRMYVFDLGNIPVDDAGLLFQPPIKVAKGGCCVIVGHLIVHPRGTLIWDTGVVPDELIGSGKPGTEYYKGKPFRAQLAEIGYRPEDITYVGLSHYHFDHTANTNLFKSSTWIVQDAERNAMLAAMNGTKLAGGSQPEPHHYNLLKDSKTIALANMNEYDVFGDGTVVVMAAHGHTAGQQVLVVNFPKMGRIMLSGDLYHFREEREQQVLPHTLEYDKEASRLSRVRLEAWAKANNVPVWIEHDTRLYAGLKKAPAYIE
jgi:glyoxylase-like metal-dependent hydrolase (beta-lactamase superfamily II)